MLPWARAAADARGERKREAEHGNHHAHRAGRAGVRAAVGAAEVGQRECEPSAQQASTKLAQTGNYALRHVGPSRELSPCGRPRCKQQLHLEFQPGAFRDFDTRPQTVVPPLREARAATMPPKVEGPTMIVVTTDEEFAMVHAAEGEQCSDAVKGFLHAALCKRRLRRWLRSQQCRSRQSVGRRHGRHACGSHAHALHSLFRRPGASWRSSLTGAARAKQCSRR